MTKQNFIQLTFLIAGIILTNISYCQNNKQNYLTKKQYKLIKEIADKNITYQEKGSIISTFLKTVDTTTVVEIFGQNATLLNSMFITEFLERLRFLEYGNHKKTIILRRNNNEIIVQYKPIRNPVLENPKAKKVKPIILITSLVSMGYGVERLVKYIPLESDFVNRSVISEAEFVKKYNRSRGDIEKSEITNNLAIGVSSLLTGFSLITINSTIKISVNGNTTQSLSLNLNPSSVNLTYSF